MSILIYYLFAKGNVVLRRQSLIFIELAADGTCTSLLDVGGISVDVLVTSATN